MTISDNARPAEVSGRRRGGLGPAFGYAFAGLRAAWTTEPNLRIHAAITVVVVAAGLLARLPLAGWALVVFAVTLVVAAELLNSAIESVVDLVSPQEHPLAKRAKDVAAAAVLVAAAGAVAIGALLIAWTVAGAAYLPSGMV